MLKMRKKAADAKIGKGFWRLQDIWFMLGIILLVFWIIFTSASVTTMRSLERKSIRNMQEVLEVAASQIESRLEQMENFLTVLLVSDTRLNALRNSEIGRVSNLRDFVLQMEADGQYFSEFSGIFFSDPEEEIMLDKQWNDLSLYSFYHVQRRLKIRELMAEMSTGEGTDGAWRLEKVEDTWTAFYVSSYQGQYLGVYVSLDGVLNRITDLTGIEGVEDVFLRDGDGRRLTGDNPDEEDVSEQESGEQLTRSLGNLPVELVASLPKKDLNGSQIILWGGCLMLAVLSGLVLIFLLSTLQRALFAPLGELNRQMKLFSEGKLDTYMTAQDGCQEVRELAKTFNEMTVEIRDMKIENYEKQLENQETILKYFQIQKNPHFFLNVLNGIYSLAATGNMIQVRRITLELIRHVRYILAVEKAWVSLEEELEFSRNYLEIQRIRFPYEIRMEEEGFTEEAMKVLVPPLVLQTFVENAIKYALSPENVLSIRLAARLKEKHLELRISDSGPGFTEEVINELNTNGKPPTDERGEHIGIHNVLARMKLLYHDACAYHFHNRPSGGAEVELILPLEVGFSKTESPLFESIPKRNSLD